jgi:hypothetical protein
VVRLDAAHGRLLQGRAVAVDLQIAAPLHGNESNRNVRLIFEWEKLITGQNASSISIHGRGASGP